MPIQQAFPNLDTPLVEPDTGNISLVWFRFLIALWNRTGSAHGNDAASFLYPATSGNPGQVLTSEGATKATIWTTLLTKLSQFANDAGFITAADVAGFSTPDSTNTQIKSNLSTSIPPPDTANGSAGTSTFGARSDHAHPTQHQPVFTKVTVNTVTWTTGSGAPSGAQPNGSLYSNTSGGAGARLYVSNGATWTPVPSV